MKETPTDDRKSSLEYHQRAMPRRSNMEPTVGRTSDAPTGRFDYVKYDEQAQELQAAFKGNLESIEGFIETSLKSPRAKALALTKLEECYMWIGKAIRDDQVSKRSAELQEGRTDS